MKGSVSWGKPCMRVVKGRSRNVDHQFEKEEFDVVNPRPGYSTLCSAMLFCSRAMQKSLPCTLVDEERADKLFVLDACIGALR